MCRYKNYFFLIATLYLVLSSCAVKWTKAIQKGEVYSQKTIDTVGFETIRDLIIIPVTIKGKEYRFLFDTGAPFSISKELQGILNYKIISKGNIVDSDHNRKVVNWVTVDSITIGKTHYTNHSAFIGDFSANPIYKCLNIDGIIGANLIRHNNWTINPITQALLQTPDIKAIDLKNHTSIPFQYDYQYNMFIDVDFGTATLHNILIDYGSNGSFALTEDIFNKLNQKKMFGKTFTDIGKSQHGIVGTEVPTKTKITTTDSIYLGKLHPTNTLVKTGKTTSIGNSFYKNYQITIDWKNKKLHFIKTAVPQKEIRLSGFKIGFKPEKEYYIQSVIKASNAYNKGIRTNMKVRKLNSLDFSKENTYCDYVRLNTNDAIYLQVQDSLGNYKDFYFKKTPLK